MTSSSVTSFESRWAEMLFRQRMFVSHVAMISACTRKPLLYSLLVSVYILFVCVYILFVSVYILFVSVYILFVSVYILFVCVYILFVCVYILFVCVYILFVCVYILFVSVYTLLCFCSFDLSCPILEKYIFIENMCTVLSRLIK